MIEQMPARARLMAMRTIAPLTLAALLFSLPGWAGAQDATKFIEKKHDEVATILAAKKVDGDKLSKALDGLLDYDTIAKDALGSEWDKRSSKERQAFTERLKRLIESNYKKNVRTTADYKIEYGEQVEKKGRTVVPTTARSKRKRRAPAVEVVYWLEARNGSFAVVDVETDGVGLVSTYRRQFRKILRKDGWQGLIARMDERLSAENS